jgi:hypothetical protein
MRYEEFMKIPKIESYRFGKIVIDGKSYQKDVIIFPEGVRPNWWRQLGHSLSIADLEDVIATHPKALIVGLGAFSRMVIPAATLAQLEAVVIEVLASKTETACQIYNQHRDEGDIMAALHLTF